METGRKEIREWTRELDSDTDEEITHGCNGMQEQHKESSSSGETLNN